MVLFRCFINSFRKINFSKLNSINENLDEFIKIEEIINEEGEVLKTN